MGSRFLAVSTCRQIARRCRSLNVRGESDPRPCSRRRGDRTCHIRGRQRAEWRPHRGIRRLHLSHRELIIVLAAKHRVPAVYTYDFFAKSGGLLGYSVDFFELLRQAVVYIDRILKGAKPADLPVQQATKFQLFINLKTAKELGITVPPSLLVQADEVIE
jgi:hypothetical protein